MTVLYKPVLIESAEQAEALPDGAVLVREDHFAFQKHAGHFVSADPHDLPTGAAWEVVGWTALVPIEAEEESGAKGDGMDEDFYLTRRLVTRWEDAS